MERIQCGEAGCGDRLFPTSTQAATRGQSLPRAERRGAAAGQRLFPLHRLRLPTCGEPAAVRGKEERRWSSHVEGPGGCGLGENHYRANDEASHARGQIQRSTGFAAGSGAVLVPQVEAFEKETAELNFSDMFLTFGTLFLSDVVWALSLRADCRSDWGVDKSGSKLFVFS